MFSASRAALSVGPPRAATSFSREKPTARHTAQDLNTGRVTEEIGYELEEPRLQPLREFELGFTPLTQFWSRSTSPTPHVAELYHENSKLTRWDCRRLANDQSLSAAQDWFIRSTYLPSDDPAARHDDPHLVAHGSLPTPLQPILAQFEIDPLARRLFAV